ncbi:hypothetical protein F511_03978 [Dorcoceras hygrometricum]|uniref:Integrase catalytic domain-containing protein n=1 Tax=Dorcoceras hygrometricum TaxID=472368 RepID=A0A2Z7D1F7_9LAMI|nr:hypothetical protein F511_03978 [Dorcoceras hygrometricum]
MDFVVGLPRTVHGFNAIWVIVDRLTKSAHFLPVKTTYDLSKYAELYVKEIVRLHGIPSSIVSDRDPRFTSRFWISLHKALGTKLTFSTAFHPQTDGQSERVIKILEDLLRACVLDYSDSWDTKLPLVEFAYNNNGIPSSIVSDRDPRFTSRFWISLHKALGTKLTFSTAFHPQTDGQSERVIKILEDLLRACVLDYSDSWDTKLPLVEFAYNNSYQNSIEMAPYEALYGRKCRSPIHWDDVG